MYLQSLYSALFGQYFHFDKCFFPGKTYFLRRLYYWYLFARPKSSASPLPQENHRPKKRKRCMFCRFFNVTGWWYLFATQTLKQKSMTIMDFLRVFWGTLPDRSSAHGMYRTLESKIDRQEDCLYPKVKIYTYRLIASNYTTYVQTTWRPIDTNLWPGSSAFSPWSKRPTCQRGFANVCNVSRFSTRIFLNTHVTL